MRWGWSCVILWFSTFQVLKCSYSASKFDQSDTFSSITQKECCVDWKKLTYCIEEETTTFDVVVNISEPHLFSVQQLNIETVHIVLRDYSLQSSIFENESKFICKCNKYYVISESSSQLKYWATMWRAELGFNNFLSNFEIILIFYLLLRGGATQGSRLVPRGRGLHLKVKCFHTG